MHAGEDLVFGGSVPPREECWERLGPQVQERVNARLGDLLDWWAVAEPEGIAATVLGTRAFVQVIPVIKPSGGRAYKINSLPLVETSFKRVRIDEPATAAGRAPGGGSPAEMSVGDAPHQIDAEMAGCLGNLPPRAQQLLQAPFLRGRRELWYDECFRLSIRTGTLKMWLFLTDRHVVTFAGGLGHGYREAIGTATSWDLTSWRADVDRSRQGAAR